MRQTRCLVCALLMVALMLAVPAPRAGAQPTIPPELRQTSSALTAAEDRLVRDAIAAALTDLTSDEPTRVMEARRRLVDPLEMPNTSEIFAQAYSSHLKLQLPPTLEDQRLFVRLNAVIVASYLTDRTAIELLAEPLADEAPAVRYRAAKAVGMIVHRARYNNPADRAQTEAQAMEMLAARMRVETAAEAWQPLLESLGTLQIPQARLALLDALNLRINEHAQRPGMPLSAEHTALINVYRSVVEQSLQPGGVAAPVATALARTTCRYMVLSARMLAQAPELDEAAEAQYREMIIAADTVLRWVVRDHLRLTVALPPAVEPKLRDGLWAEVLLDAGRWQTLLAEARLGLSAADLEVPAPAEP
jgi:hypothetical protein